jgi:hypothetical protein
MRAGLGLGGTLAVVALTALPALAIGPPDVTGYTPATGVAGVSLITINGDNFFNDGATTAVTSVIFSGGVPATHSGDTDTTIPNTLVPCGAIDGPVTVTTSGGGGTDTGPSFDVTSQGAPAVSPATGAIGATVTVTGSNFCGTTAVTINGLSVTRTIVSNTSMTVVVPSTTVGTGSIAVTNSSGGPATATFTVTAAGPTITSFSPTTGPIGTSVLITGTGFTGATSVRFGTGSTTSFTVNSTGTQITATVPSSGTTGTIGVTTAAGTGSSTGTFTVTGGGQHDRSVTFSFGNNSRVTGNVNTSDGFAACASFVPVVIQKQKGGSWKWVDTTATTASGSFKTYIPPSNGTFRAKVNKLTLVNGAICDGDTSPSRHS